MRKSILTVLTLFGFVTASVVAPVAQAGVITTDAWVQQAHADEQRAQVADMLQREDVRERMIAMGVDPDHVQARLAGLSDAEVAELAKHMEDMPAGAGIVEVLLFVVLVFVILDIAGVTDVFPFINSAE